MHFNIIVGNHGELEMLEALAPIVNYVRATLSVCGHTVAVVQHGLHSGAVNLFFEHFPDPVSFPVRLREMKQRHRLKVGVIATELMLQNTIPYARNGIHIASPEEKDDYLERRIAGFNAVVPEVDFLWAFLKRTADEYRSRCRLSRFFPVGHLHPVPAETRRSEKDIDIVFFGTMTPHRQRILERLAADKSLNTVFVGRQPPSTSAPAVVSPGFYPSYMLSSLLDRAKIGLNLTLCALDECAPDLDPRFVSCARVTEMLERDVCIVSEEIPQDNPYADYMISAAAGDLPDTCVGLLRSGEWRERGPRAAARFRDEMDVRKICSPVIEETLDALDAGRPG